MDKKQIVIDEKQCGFEFVNIALKAAQRKRRQAPAGKPKRKAGRHLRESLIISHLYFNLAKK